MHKYATSINKTARSGRDRAEHSVSGCIAYNNQSRFKFQSSRSRDILSRAHARVRSNSLPIEALERSPPLSWYSLVFYCITIMTTYNICLVASPNYISLKACRLSICFKIFTHPHFSIPLFCLYYRYNYDFFNALTSCVSVFNISTSIGTVKDFRREVFFASVPYCPIICLNHI